MKTALFIAYLIAVIAGSTFLGLYLAKDEVCTYTYSGREVFQTQEEYSAFKTVMGQDEVTWYQMDVLSSDPPIVAEFKVNVVYGIEVPYGEVSRVSEYPTTVGFLAGIGLGFPAFIWVLDRLRFLEPAHDE